MTSDDRLSLILRRLDEIESVHQLNAQLNSNLELASADFIAKW
jgi:hypothetical protein